MSKQPLKPISKARFVAGVIAALALTPSLAHAANATWSGATSGNWSVTTNWSASPVPGTGDTATFNAASSNTTLDLGSGVTISTLLFDTANAAAYTIGSGGAGSQTLTLNNSGAITRESTVTNNELINANLTLGTASAGTYTVTNNGTTGSITLAGAISGAIGGAKTLNIRGNGTTNITGNVSLGSATGLTLNIIGNSNSTISGRITGNVAVTQSTGSTAGSLTLNNDANDFTGRFRAEAAYGAKVFFTSIADFGIASALGQGTAGTTISLSNAHLVYTGAASSSSNRTWTGTNGNVIENSSATGVLSLSGNFEQTSANGTLTLRGTNTGANTFAGSISVNATSGASVLNLAKENAGRWILSGNNSYTGNTTVSGGILQFAKTTSLYNGTTSD
ncbi:MAG: autotransporter-associated beta strand repeat-containing protein, partial [Spartobacteria bacterium]